ncbi:MAG: hypothetical protein C0507_19430 [Cyanobacteria bacterium PR.3.49]|nr:hypothetical protein [Cyanobacteria bacterium PR.3.49]
MPIRAIFLGICVCIFSLTGCTTNQNEAKNADKEPELQTTSLARIECEKVKREKLSPVVHCTGQIKPIFGKEYVVSSRLPGRISKINVAPGEKVRKGQILAYVDSQQISEIEAEAIRAASRLSIAKAHEERELRVYQEELLRPKALISARTARQQAEVSQRAAERNHKRLESLHKEGIAAEKDYLNAKSNLEKANLDLEQAQLEEKREEKLFSNKALIRKNWQLAHAETQTCQNELETVKERLRFLGVYDDTVGESITSRSLQPLVPIISPGDGILVQQLVSTGEIVNPDEQIFSVCNLNKVAICCELPESELSAVSNGLPVKVTVSSYGEQTFSGVITYVGSKLDPKTRTVPVRAVIDNQKGLLKLNMFATVDIVGKEQNVIACSRDALHESEGKTVVYVRKAPEQYDRRVVATGIASGDKVEIVSGLKGGEEVVTAGGVLVKAKLLMGNAGDRQVN